MVRRFTRLSPISAGRFLNQRSSPCHPCPSQDRWACCLLEAGRYCWQDGDWLETKGEMKRAFTLVELLVTIAITAVLSTLALRAAGVMRMTGQKAKCANSLRQLGVANALYL